MQERKTVSRGIVVHTGTCQKRSPHITLRYRGRLVASDRIPEEGTGRAQAWFRIVLSTTTKVLLVQ